MNSSILLNEADKLRLDHLTSLDAHPPRPDSDQQAKLHEIISRAQFSADPDELAIHAGFYDAVVLVSPTDPRDNFTFSIVLPNEADIDADKISILAPISLAALGAGVGDDVVWETPAGERVMRIASVVKSETNASTTSALHSAYAVTV